METILLGIGEIKEDVNNISYIQYKNMKIHLDKNQKWKLSDSKKTIYVVQLDENNNEYALKGFRVKSCLFFTEIYD